MIYDCNLISFNINFKLCNKSYQYIPTNICTEIYMFYLKVKYMFAQKIDYTNNLHTNSQYAEDQL